MNVSEQPAANRNSHELHEIPILRERKEDLLTVSQNTPPKFRRLFRPGELLWCSLDPPIRGPDNVNILFWPAIVVKVKFRNLPLPMEKTASDSGTAAWQEAYTPYGGRRGKEYTLRLLGLNRFFAVPGSIVLPFRAYIPSRRLLETANGLLLTCDPSSQSRINPYEDQVFENAVGPWLMGLLTAIEVIDYLCFTNRLALTGSSLCHVNIPEKPAFVYQGLWWGEERIWVGDLVRIKEYGSKSDEGSRGFLMRVGSFVVAEVVQEEGSPHKEHEVHGEVYELVDMDHEDSSGLASANACTLRRQDIPEAPAGYILRPVYPDGRESIIPLTFLCGRYYPGILAHPLAKLGIQMDSQEVPGSHQIRALAGLSMRYHNSMPLVKFEMPWISIVEKAQQAAELKFEAYKQELMI